MTGTPSLLANLLADCEAHGIRLALANGGGLEIDAPQDALTPELLDRLKAHRTELLAAVRDSELDADELLERLTDAGCLIVRDGDGWRLVGETELLPHELAESVARQWAELVDLLALEGPAIRVARRRLERDPTASRCPWCGSKLLAEGRHAGLWCVDCERLAWIARPNGVVRADHSDDGLEVIDPPDPLRASSGQHE